MFRRYSRYKILWLIVDGDGRYDCGHRIPRVHASQRIGINGSWLFRLRFACSQVNLTTYFMFTNDPKEDSSLHMTLPLPFLDMFSNLLPNMEKWGLSANHILLMCFLPKEIPEKSSFKTPALGALVRMWCYSLRSTKTATQIATNTNSFLAHQ